MLIIKRNFSIGGISLSSEVISCIEREKIIVIGRRLPTDKIVPVAEALYSGGIRLLEITFDNEGGEEETAKAIKLLSRHFEKRMLIGAGTVLNIKQVEMAKEAGAGYIISPNTDKQVIEYTKKLELVSIPGALTPTEVVCARGWGADFVKLFPAGELGLNYVKALRAPLSHIPMLAVGGINRENIKDFLSIGVQGLGIGSNILKKELIEKEDYEGLEELARDYVRSCNL